MKTSTSTKIRHLRKTNKIAGFSLLEILIAMTLMGLTLSLVFRDGVSQRDKLERALEYLQRAVRFAQAETVFRGSLVRLNFSLGSEAKYTVEFGPSGRFVIPLDLYQDKASLTLSEQEEQKKRQDQLNLDFRPVPNFARREQDFVPPITLIGVATDKLKQLQTTGDVAIYFTPQGENDAAIILVANEKEIGVLKIEAFNPDQTIEYVPLAENETEPQDWQMVVERKAEEIFKKWQNP